MKKAYEAPVFDIMHLRLKNVLMSSLPIEDWVPGEYHDIENPEEIELD